MSTTASGTVFTLRTPAHIKSCHLTGTWDKYTKRYQMNADKSAGPGWWTLTLKFGSSLPPQRYWYYVCLHFFIRLTSRSFFLFFFPDSLQQIYHFLCYGSYNGTTTSKRAHPALVFGSSFLSFIFQLH